MKNISSILIMILFILSCNNSKIKVDPTKVVDISELDASAETDIKIGVAAMLTPKETLPIYDEIIKYIGKKLDLEVEMIFTKDYHSMNEMVKNKEVVGAFVCSGAYIIGHDEWEMELIASPMHSGETNYYSNIIVNVNSNFKSFEDLKGKKFAFTDPESNTGKLVPSYQLAKLNLKPEDFFSEIIYTGSHDNSIEAVAKNIVDGAAVDNLIWDYMDSKGSNLTKRTKIIDQLGPYSTPPFVVYPELDTTIKNKLKDILLQMHQNEEGIQILNKLLIDKFIIIPDSSYNSIRNMKKWVDNI